MSTEVKAQNTISMTSVKAIADATEQSKQLLATMEQYAEDAGTTLTGIYQDAMDAQTSADNAQASADSASEYATRAYANLSTVQNITETLNWITAHGTMALTSDVALDPSHIYFVVDAQGDYVVGGTHYSVVSEPKVADISTYYELTIDESLNNYVATHLAVDSEGLWIIPDAGGNKVLIATGNGSTYSTAGTYIIGKVNNVDTVFAKFLSNGATMMAENGVQIAHLGYGLGTAQGGGTSKAPYYDLGVRRSGSTVGNYSTAEGYDATASGYCSHAEGLATHATGSNSHAEGGGSVASGDDSHAEGYGRASGDCSHAEGNGTASGDYSHAEGFLTVASGDYSHAEGDTTRAYGDCSHVGGLHTIATKDNQTAIGKYNIEDEAISVSDQMAFIIGNGTSDNARSNALTVDWNGNVDATGSIISDTNYVDAWSDTGQGYTVTGLSLAGSTYVKVDIDLGAVGNKKPIFNGFDIQGSGTARIHTLGHYIFQSGGHWYASVKMRNDNTSAISNYTVIVYIAWI